MSFGFPLGLLALLALLPLAAAYFLRRRQRPRTVSALFLWRSPSQRAQAGPRLQRFSREASFLLEALAIVFAALFLADFRLAGTEAQRHLVLVVDGSLSMAARAPGGEEIAGRVRDAAARVVGREGAGALTVVESGAPPRVLAGPQLESAKALDALERWRPRGAFHDLMPALLLAKELAGAGERVHLFTDGPLPEGIRLPPEVELTALGEASPNLAFVSAARHDEGESASVTVRVASFSDSARTAAVRFQPEGSPPHVEEVSLAPGQSVAVRATFRNAGPIEVTLPEDSLVEDGRVRLLPTRAPALDVRLLPGLGPAEAAAVKRFFQAADVTVSDAQGPSAVEGRPPIRLTVGPPGSGAELELGVGGNARSFLGPFFAQKEHSLLEDVSFGGVLWTAGESAAGRPLVTAGQTVLLAEGEDGQARLNVDLGRSNLPRTAAWPVLMGNVVRRARRASPGLPKRHLMLGEEVPVVTEPGASYALEGPAGARAILGAGAVTLPALPLPGHYRLLRDGKEVDALEVLAIDARESDLRSRGKARAEAKVGAGLSTALVGRRATWPLFVLLLLLLADYWLTSHPAPGGRGKG